MRGDAEGLRRDVDYALEQLDTDYIDIIVLCRVPPVIPIEESIEAMKQLVLEGKARHIGISEASASTIRRAHSVHPLFCIEQEWSLWSRDIEEEIVPTCKELGIKVVAYSPLGRGFLTGSIRKRDDPSMDPNDYRIKAHPKFQEGNFQINLELVDRIKSLADRKGITVGQLALAWLHAQGSFVIPIPGTTDLHHFDQNYAARLVPMTVEEKAEIDDIFHPTASAGDRYHNNHLTFHQN
jgi:aryl-alcohol dehydrogenase-like predicted oxidoreductase